MKYIISNFNRTHILKKDKLPTSKKTIIFIFFIALILLCVFASIIIFSSSAKLRHTDYYILCLGSETSLAAVEELSQQIAAGGGAGYIINNGEFKIAASAYKSKDDAIIVKERLSQSFAFAEIIDINIKATKIKFQSRKEAKQIKNVLEYPIELFDYLLQQNIQLDLQNTTESQLMLLLEAQNKELSQMAALTMNLLKAYNDFDVLIKTHEFYKQLQIDFENNLLEIESIKMLTQKIKYFICKQIWLYHDFRDSINI